MLGEIPDDPSMIRAVRSYLPVVECEPAAPSARALEQVAHHLLQSLSDPTVQSATPQPIMVAGSREPSL